ncbi:MAG: tRNA 2-selenouridine(34) synthase MnmH [Caulobacteraceae bacterium]|nr:tRNA 2-selenouridine(34) synthase MnmH [Caulobacteraceae bacterium]
MIAVTGDATASELAKFESIVDVRSPAEFLEDHVPWAINLPVLSDEERAEVGTLYVQQSRFLARRVGAAIVARNIARHLEGALADVGGDWAPLVYCWRGGQRSNAMATVLDQVGWRPTVLDGGYRTYRRRVTAALYDAEPRLRLILLDGDTGSAKTDILRRLADLGVQTLDLEDLAAHRGSLFGALPGQPQPAQKLFETRLLAAIEALDPNGPVVVEAESSKVGGINLPPMLWKAMRAAPRLVLRAPAAARARYLTTAYADILADREAIDAALARLPRHHGRELIAAWRGMAGVGDFEALARSLIEHHYDPAYRRSSGGGTVLATIDMEGLDEGHRAKAAETIASLVSTWKDRP